MRTAERGRGARLRGAFVAGAFASLAGCASEAPPPALPEPAVQTGVAVDGAVRVLEDSAGARLDAQGLVEQVRARLGRDPEGAELRVLRFVDVARAGLLGADASAGLDPAWSCLGRVCDRVEGAEAGWVALLEERARQPQRWLEHDRQRARIVALLGAGRVEEAAEVEVDVPAGPAERLLEREATRLRGEALRRANRGGEARALWEEAARGTASPDAAARLWLAALRVAQPSERARLWSAGAGSAGQALERQPRAADPIVWTQLIESRPASLGWPDAARQALEPASRWLGAEDGATPAADSARDDARAWACAGAWHRERGELGPALACFRRAEPALPGVAGERLRLEQARLLLRQGEDAAASALALGPSHSADPSVAAPALAILGSAHLRQGQAQRGLALLRRAVSDGRARDWPERPAAEADLGLAYLSLGERERGIEALHSAQEAFTRRGDWNQLRRCLRNEQRYYAHLGEADSAHEVAVRLTRVGALASGR